MVLAFYLFLVAFRKQPSSFKGLRVGPTPVIFKKLCVRRDELLSLEVVVSVRVEIFSCGIKLTDFLYGRIDFYDQSHAIRQRSRVSFVRAGGGGTRQDFVSLVFGSHASAADQVGSSMLDHKLGRVRFWGLFVGGLGVLVHAVGGWLLEYSDLRLA